MDSYVSFGYGPKNLIVMPGLSIRKVTTGLTSLKNSYKAFLNDFTVTVLEPEDNLPAGCNISNLAENSIKTLDKLGIKEAYFFGYSMGGMILQDILINHPEYVIKGVLGSTVSCVNSNNITEKWIELADKGAGDELVATMLDDIFTEDFLRKYRILLLAMFRDLSPDELSRISILTKACHGFDVSDQIEILPPKVKSSLMVIGAEGDKVFPVREIIELADLLECECYIYGSEYAHSVRDEAPDYYNRIYDFLISDSSC